MANGVGVNFWSIINSLLTSMRIKEIKDKNCLDFLKHFFEFIIF